METTAVYDKARQEFVIHTPSALAQKYWITNSAQHAQWCVTFAQMIIDGTNHGIHGFLMRIRHDDMSPVKGVRIEDMVCIRNECSVHHSSVLAQAIITV